MPTPGGTRDVTAWPAHEGAPPGADADAALSALWHGCAPAAAADPLHGAVLALFKFVRHLAGRAEADARDTKRQISDLQAALLPSGPQAVDLTIAPAETAGETQRGAAPPVPRAGPRIDPAEATLPPRTRPATGRGQGAKGFAAGGDAQPAEAAGTQTGALPAARSGARTGLTAEELLPRGKGAKVATEKGAGLAGAAASRAGTRIGPAETSLVPPRDNPAKGRGQGVKVAAGGDGVQRVEASLSREISAVHAALQESVDHLACELQAGVDEGEERRARDYESLRLSIEEARELIDSKRDVEGEAHAARLTAEHCKQALGTLSLQLAGVAGERQADRERAEDAAESLHRELRDLRAEVADLRSAAKEARHTAAALATGFGCNNPRGLQSAVAAVVRDVAEVRAFDATAALADAFGLRGAEPGEAPAAMRGAVGGLVGDVRRLRSDLEECRRAQADADRRVADLQAELGFGRAHGAGCGVGGKAAALRGVFDDLESLRADVSTLREALGSVAARGDEFAAQLASGFGVPEEAAAEAGGGVGGKAAALRGVFGDLQSLRVDVSTLREALGSSAARGDELAAALASGFGVPEEAAAGGKAAAVRSAARALRGDVQNLRADVSDLRESAARSGAYMKALGDGFGLQAGLGNEAPAVRDATQAVLRDVGDLRAALHAVQSSAARNGAVLGALSAGFGVLPEEAGTISADALRRSVQSVLCDIDRVRFKQRGIGSPAHEAEAAQAQELKAEVNALEEKMNREITRLRLSSEADRRKHCPEPVYNRPQTTNLPCAEACSDLPRWNAEQHTGTQDASIDVSTLSSIRVKSKCAHDVSEHAASLHKSVGRLSDDVSTLFQKLTTLVDHDNLKEVVTAIRGRFRVLEESRDGQLQVMQIVAPYFDKLDHLYNILGLDKRSAASAATGPASDKIKVLLSLPVFAHFTSLINDVTNRTYAGDSSCTAAFSSPRKPCSQSEYAPVSGGLGLKRSSRSVADRTCREAVECVGVELEDGAKGVTVVSVVPTGPAHRAGWGEGDVVTTVLGSSVRFVRDFVSMVNEAPQPSIPVSRIPRGKRRPVSGIVLKNKFTHWED
ncbi:hypothetical protein DIPPA_32715 [Diplonema papillatum]|nr:hypothetical protein DIPPA_32715 [Diplonema papillatum]|eukprot:gene20714-31920_t